VGESLALRLGLCSRERSCGYPSDRRLDGRQGRSGHLGGEEKSLAPVGNKAQYLAIRTPFAIPNGPFRLLLPL
jgi:hypothetical protein